MNLDFHNLVHLKKQHPAWKLLQADHAPLIASFLDKVFIQTNVRIIGQMDLVSRLEDFLFQLSENAGPETFPRSALAYLDEWALPDKGWLRKFYPPGKDEPHFDLTPASEKALAFLEGLSERRFIGTESRLLMVFELLKQMVYGVETNSEKKIAELQKRKKNIEREIQAIEAGNLPLMEGVELKDRFLHLSHIARELLADFRAVEHNFRTLDQEMREQIAAHEGQKGELLGKMFASREAIIETDQGRSFQAFWDFLMSPQSQETFSELLEKVFAMEALQEYTKDNRLKRIHFDWLEAGEQTQRTVAKLSQQLRRYLDEQSHLDNKRIKTLLDKINLQALAIKTNIPEGPFMSIEEPCLSIKLPMERPLFSIPNQSKMIDTIAFGQSETLIPDTLFNQVAVNKDLLINNIQAMLHQSCQVTLKEIIEAYPLKYGLSELITYLSIAAQEEEALFEEGQYEMIHWVNSEGMEKKAQIPRIIFRRAFYE